MSLREFLKDQQAGAAAEKAKAGEVRAKWRASLEKLVDQIRQCLLPLIEEKLVYVSAEQMRVDEEWLGPYEAQALTISAGPGKVQVRPVGRAIFGAKGRVDMFADSRPEKVYIFTLSEDEASWLIIPPRDTGAGWDHGKAKPLSREALEEALEDLLKAADPAVRVTARPQRPTGR